jgi:glutaminyl-peptide cyclotransferase
MKLKIKNFNKIFLSLIFFYFFFCNIISSVNTKSTHKYYSYNFLYSDTTSSNNDYTIHKIIKRPETYYTQGIFFDGPSTLYESGGLYGQSVLVKMEYPSLKILNKINLHKKYFGEGIAKCKDKIYQLTWNERKILRYSYPIIKEIRPSLEMGKNIKSGWGLTRVLINDQEQLAATDGSNNIHILKCNDDLEFQESKKIFWSGEPLDSLNEIEYVDGFIFANRYFDHRIFKIDYHSLEVVKVYDMSELIKKEIEVETGFKSRLEKGDVLNGIAYDTSRNIFLLTGKKWNNYYEVEFK